MLKGFDDYPVTIGDYLRGERATAGLTLEEASNRSKISMDVLEAIENGVVAPGKHISIMPGLVRSYARLLNIDEEDLVNRYEIEVIQVEAEANSIPKNDKNNGGIFKILFGLFK